MFPGAAQALHRLHLRARVPHRQALRANPHLHHFADQPRRHRVRVPLHPDRATPTHPHPRLLLRLQPARWQRLQLRQLRPQTHASCRVPLRHHRLHELPVRRPAGKVAAASQQQRLLQRLLQTAMPLLAIAVLMATRGIGRLRLQAVVMQQRLILGRVLLTIALVVYRQRHPIRAMPLRHAAQFPQRVLHTLAQAGKTLRKTQTDVFPVRVRQHEVIEQMAKRLSLQRHRQRFHVREIRRAQPTWFMHLAEEDFLGRTMLGFPLTHAPLQRPTIALPVLRRHFPLQPGQQRFGLQTRLALQLFFYPGPHRGQRIRPRPPVVGGLASAGQLTGGAILPSRLAVHTRFHRRGSQRCSLVKAPTQFLDLRIGDASSLTHRQLLSRGSCSCCRPGKPVPRCPNLQWGRLIVARGEG
jgi:hypothetical protein